MSYALDADAECRDRIKKALSDIEKTGTCSDKWQRLAAYSYELTDWDEGQYKLTDLGKAVLDQLLGKEVVISRTIPKPWYL